MFKLLMDVYVNLQIINNIYKLQMIIELDGICLIKIKQLVHEYFIRRKMKDFLYLLL